MGFENTSAAVLTPPNSREAAPAPTPSFFAHTAGLEFQATLQLLAERARFLTAATGVAIAVKEEIHFIYSATAGDFSGEAAGAADLNKKHLSECVRLGKAVRIRMESRFVLAVPVLRGAEVSSFFELEADSPFGDRDAESVARLAGMVGTAMEHRDAAVRAEKLDFQEASETAIAPPPSRWHAPEVQDSPVVEVPIPALSPVEVQKCSSCGFPVSTGRKLCVDCDKKDIDIPQAPTELFTVPAEESWLSAYGYTIASVLVSAIAIAVIVWLRAR